jgi:hypothetical protein
MPQAGLTEAAAHIALSRSSKMKPQVAVALIIMGAVLILAPIGADYLFQRHVVALLLAKEPSISPMVIPQLSTWYRVVCWLTGSVMVLIGALAPGAYARPGYLEEVEGEEDGEDEDEDNGKAG